LRRVGLDTTFCNIQVNPGMTAAYFNIQKALGGKFLKASQEMRTTRDGMSGCFEIKI
jgi:hypothetical protein